MISLVVMLSAAKQCTCTTCNAAPGEECDEVDEAAYHMLPNEDGDTEYIHSGRVEEACRKGLLNEGDIP